MSQQFEKTHNPEVNPVEYKEFFLVMDEMNKVFAGISGPTRIKLYFNNVKDLPLQAIKDIAVKFMSSSRQTPLPSDFRDAAKEWLRAKKVYVHDETPVEIECKFCGDTGINYLIENDTKEFYSLINCDCENHIHQSFKAPKWKRELSASFIRQTMPIEWSKPKNCEAFSLSNREVNALILKMEQHKRNAENFWKSAGFEA